jgi:hypothetical protein
MSFWQVPSRELEAGDHANQQHFDGRTHRCDPAGRRRNESSQVPLCCHEYAPCRSPDNRERVISCRQDDDLDDLGNICSTDSSEVWVRAVLRAASVRGFRGKHGDFDFGELDLFDERRRKELFGEHFAGQRNVHTVGSKSAGRERERIES